MTSFTDLLKRCQRTLDNTPLLNIHPTEVCNFRCAHCLSDASPDAPRQWMTPGDAYDILSFARHFNTVRFNFVGGEPTLKPQVLQMLSRILEEHPNPSFEMTTNGWWLFSNNSLAKVTKAITTIPYVIVRVSHSAYHRPFRDRSAALVLDGGTNGLMNWLESGMIERDMGRQVTSCPSCGESCDSHESPECPQCGQDLHDGCGYDERGWAARDLIDMINEDRLFVDIQDKSKTLVTGRAARTQVGNTGGYCEHNEGGDMEFSFGPGARIIDFCCSGGRADGGHASEGLGLFVKRALFMMEIDKAYGPALHSWNAASDDRNWRRCEGCIGIASKMFAANKEKVDELVRKVVNRLEKENEQAA